MIERHLPYFVVVAEEEHFQRAADRLGITQSALSRRVQLLEEELGFRLFERLPRGVKLSLAGESFYHDVRKYRDGLNQARLRAQSIMKGVSGRITIAVNPSSASNPIVTRMFQIFRKFHSGIEVNLQVIYSEQQLTELQNNHIDVGIVYQFDREPWATYLDVSSDRLVLAMPRDHPLAEKSPLELEDLKSVPFIWPKRAHSPRLYDHLIAMWNARGVSPNISTEVQSVESVLSIVDMGMAFGFITENQVHQVPETVVIRQIEGLDIRLPLSLVWRGDYSSPVLSHLTTALSMAIESRSSEEAV